MSRRLRNRTSGRAAPSTAANSRSADLPDYEPPSFPLNEAARCALGELSNNRRTAVFQTQLDKSMRFLSSSVGDMHERLRQQRERLEAMKKRRVEKGLVMTDEEERLQKHVDEMEKETHGLTVDSEQAIRDLIDQRVRLEDDSAILRDLYTQAATSHASKRPAARRPRNNPDLEDDPDESNVDPDTPPPVAGTLDAFRAKREEKLAEYNAMSAYERYALNNDYAAFKKLWHDAMAREEGAPLPDASRWFRPDGQPVMAPVGSVPDDTDEADADNEVAVSREVLSANCPLTLRVMEQPYSNRKCKHTFEKAAILEYLPMRGTVQCPQSGCFEAFSRLNFEEDFYLDQAVLRRIKRSQERRDLEDEDEDEDEDVDINGDVESKPRSRSSMRLKSQPPETETEGGSD